MAVQRKITPRARRAAKQLGIAQERLPLSGSGWMGAVSERDVLELQPAAPIVRASPLARRIAQVEGCQLEGTGSGPHGKMMKADVLARLESSRGAVAAATSAAAVPLPETEAGQSTPDGKTIREVVPYSGVRRIIGDRLAGSWQAAPHVFFTVDVEMDPLLALRKDVNDAQEKKVSVTDFVTLAVSRALAKYPDINVMLEGDRIYKFSSINIGIAVAADNGLIVPVVRNTQDMSLTQVSAESARLVAKARDGKLIPADYSGGTFTVSNLGMFGIDHFTAIINPPESGILAIAATQRKPVVRKDREGNEAVVIRSMMTLIFSADHRVIDGLLAAQFIGEIRNQLENPLGLLL